MNNSTVLKNSIPAAPKPVPGETVNITSVTRNSNKTRHPRKKHPALNTPFLTLCLLLTSLFAAQTQAQILVGDTVFWFAAPDLDETIICGPGDSPMMLLITNNPTQEAHVTIWMNHGGSPIVVKDTIAPGGSFKYDIPTTNRGYVENPRISAGTVTDYGIRVTSDVPVTAYYQILPPCSQDIFAFKGAAALGSEFYVPMIHDSYYYTGSGYPLAFDQIDIVAAEDGTAVHVVPTQQIKYGSTTSPAYTQLNWTLDKGQTLKIMEEPRYTSAGSPSLGGTHIWTDNGKPIAVTTTEDLIGRSGHSGWDMIGDQVVPVTSLGKRYVVIKGYNNAPELVYMIATVDNTVISVNNGSTTDSSGPLNAGDCYQFNMGSNNVVTVYANEPFYCYQITGTGSNELGSALLPSIYSVSQTQLSFYSYDQIYLLLLFRNGSEDDFYLSYGNTATQILPTNLSIMTVPGMSEWRAAKYTLPAATQGQVVTLKNTSSMFGMGCFVVSSGGTSFGYLSAFGTLAFPDTMYKCIGNTVTLDAGYGESYSWKGPNGFTSTASTITVSDTGRYTVTVHQDPFDIMDTTVVLNRFLDASIAISGGIGNDVGAGEHTCSVDLGEQSAIGISYLWRVDGLQVSTAPTYTATWTNDDEHLITVEITDAVMGCPVTLRTVHYPLPDNMSDAQCFTEPPETVWDIERKYMSELTAEKRVQAYAQPYVGDLDNDGVPEIVTLNHPRNADPHHSNAILIFNPDLTFHGKIDVPESQTYVTLPLALADVNSDGTCEIVYGTGYDNITDTDLHYRLQTYYKDGTPGWTSSAPYFASFVDTRLHSCAISIADLDGDGLVEIFCGERIFAGESGALLATLPAGGRAMHYDASSTYENGYLPAIGDIDGDGIQEIVCGNTTYRVTISDRASDANTVEIVGTINEVDGYTSLADIDRDGILDVVVVGREYRNDDSQLYVWQGTGTANNRIGNTVTGSSHTFPSGHPDQGKNGSRPFIGDIDGDGWADIAYTSHSLFGAFKYIPATNTFQMLFHVTTTDTSAATTMSMFDFNLDGEVELVYRDESTLRIIGKDGTNLATPIPCWSGTHTEYPVIVDLDGDGHAEILVSGREDDTQPLGGGRNDNIRLMVFGSQTPYQWTAARSVWNQHAYNSTNINDDMSVPRYPMNNAIAFPGDNGMPGDNDDVRPYNNFLQQQTPRSIKGLPLWTLPRPAVDSTFYHYDAIKDSMYVTVDVINTGDAPFSVPFRITVYKNTVSSSAVKYTYEYLNPVPHDDTTRITFGIPDYLATFGNADTLRIRLNDAGNTVSDQAVCDSIDRDASGGTFLLAMNDYYSTFVNRPIIFDPELNDTIPPLPFTLNVGLPGRGTRTSPPAADPVQYTPPQDGDGIDTIHYTLSQQDGKYTSTAAIYIYIAGKPDNIDTAACYVHPQATKWGIREVLPVTTEQVHNLGPLTVGDLDDSDTTLIIGFLDYHGSDMAAHSYMSEGLKIFYFDRAEQRVKLKKTIPFESGTYASTITSPAIARYSGEGYIVVPRNGPTLNTMLLYAYGTDGTKLWESSAPYSSNSTYFATVVNIADFNHDGIPEVYAGNRIFSLATGEMLCSGGDANNTGVLYRNGGDASMAADIVPGNGALELCAGTQIYRVNIPHGATHADQGSMSVIDGLSLPDARVPSNASKDGATQVVDIDGDGVLEVIVITRHSAAQGGQPVVVYAWKPLPGSASHLIGHYTTPHNSDYYSIPMIGNIDSDPYPEIVYIGDPLHMYALKYDPARTQGDRFVEKWEYGINDGSACTGMTLFDFNNDGKSEIVYRDETHLYIIDGSTSPPRTEASFANVHSYTLREYPVIADIDGDGQAEIVVTGGMTNSEMYNGHVRVFKSDSSQWAPARSVWNQYAYNATNVNEDLTIPAYPLYPATFFAGDNDQFDIQPYNNFRRQQTTLSREGTTLWATPDAIFVPTPTPAIRNGDSIAIHLCIANQGDATLGNPFYVSLYKDNISTANYLATDSINEYIAPGQTACLTAGIVIPEQPFVRLIARLNDRGKGDDPWYYQLECEYGDSIRIEINPALDLMMRKEATLNSVTDTGRYSNPVSVLYSDTVTYKITAINANMEDGDIIIRDTLPAYLKYVGHPIPDDSGVSHGLTSETPPRDTVVYKTGASSYETVTFSFDATPAGGVAASQPLFINSAWVQVSDTLFVKTNRTYHQGAGVAVVTFSAAGGGSIYNADRQALDYRTSPRAGVLVVPDSGYAFAGWSHDEYTSLRGERIAARSGIMHCDTLVIYGNVELRADFSLNHYPIRYHLNDAENVGMNPASYTVTDAAITLAPPHKPGDVFTGWTGSNGDIPQETVTIPRGSTGDRQYYANFRYSGRDAFAEEDTTDKIWSFAGEAFIRTSQTGSIVRIYTPDGVLHRQHTILAPGVTKLRLATGVYIVTLNSDTGCKIVISE